MPSSPDGSTARCEQPPGLGVPSGCTWRRVPAAPDADQLTDLLMLSTTSVTEIHQLLTPGTIRVGLPGRKKEEVIDGIVSLLEGHPAVRDLEAVREAVLERETIMSTGVGKGLGLPHAKTPAVAATVAAFAVTEAPVDFGAIDNKPVRLVFLLIGTEVAKSQHIKLLSRISRLMNRDGFRERLLTARTVEEVQEAFAEGEAHLLDH